MNRFQRVRFAVVLAGSAGMLSWPGVVVTAGPASAAAATWLTVDGRVSARGSIRVPVRDRASTTTTTCSLILLPAAPAGYLRRGAHAAQPRVDSHQLPRALPIWRRDPHARRRPHRALRAHRDERRSS